MRTTIPAALQAANTVKEIDAGGIFTCAIKADDTLACWGGDGIVDSIKKFGGLPEIAPLAADLGRRLEQWGRLTAELGLAAKNNPDEVGAAATDYLHVSGYICLAWCWLVAAGVAAKKHAEDPSDDFYTAKLVTARHYFSRILPRVDSHAAAARAGLQVADRPVVPRSRAALSYSWNLPT